MSRTKTQNIPDLQALLAPRNPLTQAVEQAMLRGHSGSRATSSVAEQIAKIAEASVLLVRKH